MFAELSKNAILKILLIGVIGVQTTFAQITISTEAELRALATAVNNGNTYSGQTIKLANDIALTGGEWVPIGGSLQDNPFQGVFDGQGYTISGLWVNGGSYSIYYLDNGLSAAMTCAGLFGFVLEGGQITNVNVVATKIKAIGSYNIYAGGLACYYASALPIENSSVEADSIVIIDSYGYSDGHSGGLVGFVSFAGGELEGGELTIKNSYATGNVSNSSRAANSGGLVGNIDCYTNVVIDNSYATGNVSGSNFVNSGISESGGLVGLVFAKFNMGERVCYGTVAIENSYATGNVSASAVCEPTILDNCWDSQEIAEGGGLVGAADGEILLLENSHATGDVFVSFGPYGEGYSGGLVGFGDIKSISNSYATGNVSGGGYSGGLVGYAWNYEYPYLTITDSYSTGNISGGISGGLAGSLNTPSSIANSHATGNISGGVSGGLVGELSNGYFLNSYATGNVSAVSSEAAVAGGITAQGAISGGLIGYGDIGAIDNCHATGDVSATAVTDESHSVSAKAGGLVGRLINGMHIFNSYATGNVSTTASNYYGESYNDYAGGLIGHTTYEDFFLLINSYATGDVSGKAYVGGLVGYNVGPIVNSYASGKVTGGNASEIESGLSNVGGLVGYLNAAGSYFYPYIINSYYDSQTSGQNDIGKGTPKTTEYMQSEDFIENLNFAATAMRENLWSHSQGKYPTLSNEPGSGTAILKIKTLEQLQTLTDITSIATDENDLTRHYQKFDNLIGRHYELASDLDFGGSEENQWRPIGARNKKFQGTFDGGGHVISGIYISDNTPNSAYSLGALGLFGNVKNSSIKNLGVIASYIKTQNEAGGLAGIIDNSTISNSYAIVDTIIGTGGSFIPGSGAYHVGILAGVASNSTIINSYGEGKRYSIESYDGSIYESTASLVGWNNGAISNSYFVGGILVNTNSGTITNCYSAGDYSCLVGTNQDGNRVMGWTYGTIASSYYNSQLAQKEGNSCNSGEGTGRTTANMQNQAFVTTLNTTAATIEGASNWVYIPNNYPTFEYNRNIPSSSSTDTPSSSSGTPSSSSTTPSSSSTTPSSSSGGNVTPSSSSDGNTPILTQAPVRELRATPLYYNLKGEPLGTSKPQTSGVYIEKSGKQMRKIVVK